MNKTERVDEVIDPTVYEGYNFQFYQHTYLFGMQDKIYHSKLPEDIRKGCLEVNDVTQINEHLAGDIVDERGIARTPENAKLIRDIKKFMVDSLTNVFARPVYDVSFSDPQTGFHNIWVNRMKKGEYNPHHNHAGVFSFVAGLDIPEEIRKEHLNQTGTDKSRGLLVFMSQRENQHLKFNLGTGDSLLFTSDHTHLVYPFFSDLERVTLSGNIYEVKFQDGEVISS